jgi:transcriptional regulator with XRE-family HTH domain
MQNTVPAALIDDNDDRFPLVEFGARLRQLRAMKKLSLAELSQGSRVSVAMLSHIERGQATPSLNTLRRISRALGVEFSDLFQKLGLGDNPGSSTIVRRADRIQMEFKNTGMIKELLSPVRTSDLELLMLVLSPEGNSGMEPWMRNGEKAGVVISGRFELTIGTTTFELESGDSFQFDGSIPHSFKNLSTSKTEVLWIIKSEAIA